MHPRDECYPDQAWTVWCLLLRINRQDAINSNSFPILCLAVNRYVFFLGRRSQEIFTGQKLIHKLWQETSPLTFSYERYQREKELEEALSRSLTASQETSNILWRLDDSYSTIISISFTTIRPYA